MEKEFIRTQRLRASGELSAGVSHNLNNILTGVLMPAQMLKLKTEDPEFCQGLDEIITYGQRARDLVHRLHLSVQGIEEDKPEPISINEVIPEAVQTARPKWKDEPESRGIGIELDMPLKDVPAIQGTRSRLHDILTNFIFNAVDAMPEGGTISIETRLADLGMSGLSGNRVAQEIRQRDPLIATVLITGWELDEKDPRLEPFDLEIGKPFGDLDEIDHIVAQAITLHDERTSKGN